MVNTCMHIDQMRWCTLQPENIPKVISEKIIENLKWRWLYATSIQPIRNKGNTNSLYWETINTWRKELTRTKTLQVYDHEKREQIHLHFANTSCRSKYKLFSQHITSKFFFDVSSITLTTSPNQIKMHMLQMLVRNQSCIWDSCLNSKIKSK